MSQEDVAVVRDWVSRWTGRELVSAAAEPGFMDSILEGLHPELEARFADELPDVETYQGREGARRMFAEWLEPWDEYRQGVLDLVDAGDSVVITYDCHGSGKGSGAGVDMEVTHVLTVRDGKIARLREYMTKSEALEAAGLRE
jgi:ketosteroid isomerase-like protein